jgi:hypothetical protein
LIAKQSSIARLTEATAFVLVALAVCAVAALILTFLTESTLFTPGALNGFQSGDVGYINVGFVREKAWGGFELDIGSGWDDHIAGFIHIDLKIRFNLYSRLVDSHTVLSSAIQFETAVTSTFV